MPADGAAVEADVAGDVVSSIATPVRAAPAFQPAERAVQHSVSVLEDGDLVFSWTDLDTHKVVVERFEIDGSPVGSRLSPFADYDAYEYRLPFSVVAGLGDGGFAVGATLWVRGDLRYRDALLGWQYEADDAVGSPHLIFTGERDQARPTATTLADGGALFVWEDWWRDGSESSIYAQRFDANGDGVTSSFRANGWDTAYVRQYEPAGAGLTGGGYVVTWTAEGVCDGEREGVYTQRYAPDNSRVGDEFAVARRMVDDQFEPSVAAMTDGGYVVTWTSGFNFGDGYVGDGSVRGQRFADDGTEVGSEFLVGAGSSSAVVALPDGGFVVTRMTAETTLYGPIYGQRYAWDGVPVGDQFLVTQSGYFDYELIVSPDDGGFFVTWSSAEMLHAQRFELPANAAPTAILLDDARVPENAPAGTVVGIAAATDPDAGDSFTWGLIDDAGGRFAIDPATGAITTTRGLDYEAAPAHDVTVRVFDAARQFHDATVTIDVEDVTTGDIHVGTPGDDIIAFPEVGTVDGVDGGDGTDLLIVTASAVTMASTADGTGLTFELDGIDGAAADGTVDRVLTAWNVEAVEIRAGTARVGGDVARTGLERLTHSGGTGADILDATGLASALPIVARGEGGDDVLTGGPGDDLLVGGPGADTLTGGPGIDGVDYSASSGRVTVSLTSGNGWYGHAGGDVLAEIENVVGSAYDDRLKGDSAANRLEGGAGDDILDGQRGDDLLIGGAGADRLLGGLGVDTADYSASNGRVTVSLTSGNGWYGHAGGDVLVGIENVIGSVGDDRLKGDGAANRLDGGAGNDVLDGQRGDDILAGGAGADRLIGGAGIDTADYAASNGRVTVSLSSGNGWYGDAGGDTLSGIENLVGSAYDDALKGDGAANRLEGGAGNDTLDGQGGNDVLAGGPGADRLIGGAGIDTADYSGSAAAVTVSLASGRAWYGDAAGDTLFQVEAVIGSAFDDTLKGDAGPNVLEGGAGNDRLTGGPGSDIFVFADGSGRDTIYDFAAGAGTGDVIDLSQNSVVNSFADVLMRLGQSGLDTLIDLGGGNRITLLGVERTALHADDFLF